MTTSLWSFDKNVQSDLFLPLYQYITLSLRCILKGHVHSYTFAHEGPFTCSGHLTSTCSSTSSYRYINILVAHYLAVGRVSLMVMRPTVQQRRFDTLVSLQLSWAASLHCCPISAFINTIHLFLALHSLINQRCVFRAVFQIYGAVTMNNTLCLGLFLLVVFLQKLTWNYTAEVTAIVIPTLIVGIFGASGTTFRTYSAWFVLQLYIVGILIVLAFKEFAPGIN